MPLRVARESRPRGRGPAAQLPGAWESHHKAAAAGSRRSPPQPCLLPLVTITRRLLAFPLRKWGKKNFFHERRGAASRCHVPSNEIPLDSVPSAACPNSEASSAEVFHVDRSLASHKMGPRRRPPSPLWAPPFCEAAAERGVCNG